MKTRYIIMMLVTAAMLLAGCNKWDCNGDLDGMWQLTEWRDKDNKVKATKQNMIFYSFQLQMASFRRQKGGRLYSRSSMKATPEQITIFDPIEYAGSGHDNILPMSVLAPFGVPADGIFHVKTLTGSTMMLTTNNQDVLTFRKY